MCMSHMFLKPYPIAPHRLGFRVLSEQLSGFGLTRTSLSLLSIVMSWAKGNGLSHQVSRFPTTVKSGDKKMSNLKGKFLVGLNES